MTHPALTLVTLHVHDIDRAIRFYREVLALPEGEHVLPVKWAEFKLGGVTLGLHQDDHEQGHRAPGGSSGFYIAVPNVDDFIAKCETKGARIGDKPTDYPYGRVGTLLDPDGNELMFIQA